MDDDASTLDQTLRAQPSQDGHLGAGIDGDALKAEGADRYIDLAELGVGGMGEVRLVKDRRLGREVALKRMRDALNHTEDAQRFLREVRVQGQLDHPAVVPVYELGLTPEGTPWFTMKRVRGQTLLEVLTLLKQGDPQTKARFSRWRLLAIFNTVCLCVDSAHARGVLHRDLKPSNVMLGEFGEVHVLDWGLARVQGERSSAPDSGRPVEAEVGLAQTGLGLAMGTPGYMSPEQANGLVDELDARTDVYALGVILHELLFLSPVHDGPTPAERLRTTRLRQLPVQTPGDVPPELDKVWRKACAAMPGDRFASAREVADAVERFLEGERDEVRRRELAEVELATAAAASTATHEGRGQALQALGRALALDPTNVSALKQLSALLSTPPEQTPPDAQRTLDALAATRARDSLRAGALRLGIWTVCVAATMVALGVKSLPLALCALVLLAACTGVVALSATRATAQRYELPAALLTVVCLAALGLALGPLLVMPTLAATHTMLFATNAPKKKRRWMVFASAVAVFVPPLVLSLDTWVQVRGGELILSSPLIRFDASLVPHFLLLFSLLPVVTPAVLVGRLRDAFLEAERGVVVQAAALRQLIPEGAPRAR